MSNLQTSDPTIYEAMQNEINRQTNNIVLIASENYASKNVIEAQSSLMGNKYAEGYPGRRYYAGCEYVDVAESIAIERAKQLFEMPHANVQPHSGAQANMAAYFAVLEPGDTVLGMRLDQGGHLTHGAKVSFSGNLYNFIPYGVTKDSETIDYNEIESLAKEHSPKLIVAGCSAYPRVLDFQKLKTIADNVGALLMVDMAHISGLIAGGAHPSPAGFADIITSTTQKTLRGPRGGIILTTEDLAKKVDYGVFPYSQGGPFMHVIAAKAVCFGEALTPEFSNYAHQVVRNADLMAKQLAESGMRLISGGTDNHLILADVTPLGLTGQDAERTLQDIGVIVNKNSIPWDPKPARVTSGLRVGTAAITSRGFTEPEVIEVSEIIISALSNHTDTTLLGQLEDQVKNLASSHPVPGID
ncbi:MAG: serine hydroxymethyltransferase [SAR202 cluster bacterium]|nr:serine hydroxymethyltransferase [Chloroflexota bacterium]MQG16830.1 serine hydroxymethyltransferase [SAR202 cluster bacterium]MQG36382.1 serine hydroxymethyltransferase [SAR202 cluster bacterium]MQG87185.1 serine hydroxymethyltransferase [SAR202 cluster bacterium]|tara:strand:+ start:15285 stop:16526 length:1242 start_codon:yes stop_codon:yes gene_type:complete